MCNTIIFQMKRFATSRSKFLRLRQCQTCAEGCLFFTRSPPSSTFSCVPSLPPFSPPLSSPPLLWMVYCSVFPS